MTPTATTSADLGRPPRASPVALMGGILGVIPDVICAVTSSHLRRCVARFDPLAAAVRCRPGGASALSAVIGPRLARQGRGDPEAGQHGVIEAGYRADAAAGEGKDQHA